MNLSHEGSSQLSLHIAGRQPQALELRLLATALPFGVFELRLERLADLIRSPPISGASRWFRLAPGGAGTNCIVGVLGRAQKMHDMVVHSVVFLSNRVLPNRQAPCLACKEAGVGSCKQIIDGAVIAIASEVARLVDNLPPEVVANLHILDEAYIDAALLLLVGDEKTAGLVKAFAADAAARKSTRASDRVTA